MKGCKESATKFGANEMTDSGSYHKKFVRIYKKGGFSLIHMDKMHIFVKLINDNVSLPSQIKHAKATYVLQTD